MKFEFDFRLILFDHTTFTVATEVTENVFINKISFNMFSNWT